MKAWIALAIVTGCLLIVPPLARAGGQQPLAIGCCERMIQQPVEQESPNFFDNNCGGNPGQPICDPTQWVYNPTTCIWDVDDYLNGYGTGYLAAHSSALSTFCAIADGFDSYGGDDKHAQARVTASTANLTVLLADSLGNVYPTTIISDGNGYDYTVCTQEHLPGPFPVIDLSGGGTGTPISYTLTVQNDSGKTVRSVTAVQEVFSSAPGSFQPVCP